MNENLNGRISKKFTNEKTFKEDQLKNREKVNILDVK